MYNLFFSGWLSITSVFWDTLDKNFTNIFIRTELHQVFNCKTTSRLGTIDAPSSKAVENRSNCRLLLSVLSPLYEFLGGGWWISELAGSKTPAFISGEAHWVCFSYVPICWWHFGKIYSLAARSCRQLLACLYIYVLLKENLLPSQWMFICNDLVKEFLYLLLWFIGCGAFSGSTYPVCLHFNLQQHKLWGIFSWWDPRQPCLHPLSPSIGSWTTNLLPCYPFSGTSGRKWVVLVSWVSSNSMTNIMVFCAPCWFFWKQSSQEG